METLEAVDCSPLAETILSLSEQYDAADQKIKTALLEAAERGDTESIASIMRDWIARPSTEVAERLTH